MVEEAEGLARLADLAERLRAYKTSLAYSYCFMIWASIMMGLPLALVAIMLGPWFVIVGSSYLTLFFLALGTGMATSMALMGYLLTRLGVAGLADRKLSMAWPLSFALPFALTYGALYALGAWHLMPVAWCLAGGAAYLCVGLTVERALVKQGALFARPFLLMGFLGLLISVPVLYLASQAGRGQAYTVVLLEGDVALWSWAAGTLSAMLLAGALYLLASFVASLYTLLRAERAVFRP